MSYNNIEAKLRVAAVGDAQRRVERLCRDLDAAERETMAPARLGQEVLYLERLLAAQAPGARTSSVVAEVATLRSRWEALPADAASERRAPETPCRGGEADSASAIGSFIWPGEDSEERADEVRLLSCEKRLASKLCEHPALQVTETRGAVLFRSWTDQDTADERAREHLLLLELSEEAAALRDLVDLMHVEVNKASEGLAEIEQQTGTTNEHIRSTVDELLTASATNNSRLRWVAPSLALVLLGCTGGIIHAPWIIALQVSSVGFGVGSVASLSATWHARVLRKMSEQVPRTVDPMPEAERGALVDLGHKAERDLVAATSQAEWSRVRFSLSGARAGLPVLSAPSQVRAGGSAYKITFGVKLPLPQVAAMCTWDYLHQNVAKATWTRPVDSETAARYALFGTRLSYRDLFTVTRRAWVKPASAYEPNRFCVTSTSIPEKMLGGGCLPNPSEDFKHGHLGVMGLVATALDDESCSVTVTIDTEPRMRRPTAWTDRTIRRRLVRWAKSLQDHLLGKGTATGCLEPDMCFDEAAEELAQDEEELAQDEEKRVCAAPAEELGSLRPLE